MADQTKKGKAFEYACLMAIKSALEATQDVAIENNSAVETAYSFYEQSKAADRVKMDKAANAAVRLILKLEPQLQNPDSNVPLYLSIQEDSRGIAGDVRDVLCVRKQNEWEIGISCKHNHTAVKHSRLSYTIDFGTQWFDKPCSSVYFEEIKPLFDELKELKIKNVKWSELDSKEERFYIPLLNAFVAELKRLDALYPDEISPALLKYLLGKNDFYKVITEDAKKCTRIQAYNIFGTLNRSAAHVKPQTKVTQLKAPTRILDICYKEKSGNTIIVTCDGGWALSFRIHNASTFVEPSLKFDVQLIGVPQTLFSRQEDW